MRKKMWWVVLVAVGVVVLAAVIAVLSGSAGFRRTFEATAKGVLSHKALTPGIVTEGDLTPLPEPVGRYLRYTGVVGKERVTTVRLKQKGVIRMKPDGPWRKIEAVEYYSVDPPSFVWLGQVQGGPVSVVLARDSYMNGRGRMLIRLLGLKTITDATGERMDYSSLVRYFNEMMWFPSAFLNENIHWDAVDANSAKATITDAGRSASAVLHFDQRGALINFVGDRYADAAGVGSTDVWETPIMGYGQFNGLNLPTKGEAVYRLSGGDFNYIKIEVTALEYNVTESF